jgi:hypothetical protein
METNFYIPTYIINMKDRNDRRLHIEKQFYGRSEFEPIYVEACMHEKGTIGLWQSMVKVVKMAKEREDDIIIICEDDHMFTAEYNKDYFFTNLIESDRQGVEILSGGIGGFGYVVPVAPNRYWVDWFWCTQFIVVFKSLFHKILDYEFKENDTADGVLSVLSNYKMTIYPFISVQKDFGYSDVTVGNNENVGLITRHFAYTNLRLSNMHSVSHFYNYRK